MKDVDQQYEPFMNQTYPHNFMDNGENDMLNSTPHPATHQENAMEPTDLNEDTSREEENEEEEEDDSYLDEGWSKDDEGNICMKNDEYGKIFSLDYIGRPFPFSYLLTAMKQTIEYTVNMYEDDVDCPLEYLSDVLDWIDHLQEKETGFVDFDK